MTPEFKPFPKLARLSRECIITEKIDGTNASIYIASSEGRPIPCALHEWQAPGDEFSTVMLAGSRTRWITPATDNAGFARWAMEHREELRQLGPGHHFGEWWGQGIQRGYGLTEKRFSLFNAARWCLHGETPKTIPTEDPRVVKTHDVLPPCCHMVPVLYRGLFGSMAAKRCLLTLEAEGSLAAPLFMRPEGIVVYHIAGNVGFKKTLEKDDIPKGKANGTL